MLVCVHYWVLKGRFQSCEIHFFSLGDLLHGEIIKYKFYFLRFSVVIALSYYAAVFCFVAFFYNALPLLLHISLSERTLPTVIT